MITHISPGELEYLETECEVSLSHSHQVVVDERGERTGLLGLTPLHEWNHPLVDVLLIHLSRRLKYTLH